MDVKKMVQSCVECRRGNLDKRGKSPLVSPTVITTPFQRIAFDIVGPLSMIARKNNRYILTMMDVATKFPEALPIRRGDAVIVVEGMQKFFSFVGFPKEILTDRGAPFILALVTEVNKRLGIHHLKATPYHPESNDMLERWHSSLKPMARKNGRGKMDWDILLPSISLFCIPRGSELGHWFLTISFGVRQRS